MYVCMRCRVSCGSNYAHGFFQKWGTQQHPNPLFFMYRKTIGLGDPVQKPYLYRPMNGWSIYRVCFKIVHTLEMTLLNHILDQPWNFRVLYYIPIFQINPDTSIIYIYL